MDRRKIGITGLLAGACALAVLLALPALYFAQRTDVVFGWDYAALVLPFPVWALLLRFDRRGPGFARWLEPLLLAVACPLVVTFRVVLLDPLTGAPMANALVTCGLCCVLPFALRLVVPHVPQDHAGHGGAHTPCPCHRENRTASGKWDMLG
jgi:hypothetical protein